MHPDDLKLLRAAPSGPSASESIADALGVACPNLRALSAEIWNDLDEGTKGIGWWTGHALDDQHRILISDQLTMAAKYAEQNLTEARVHLSEMKRACAIEDEILARAVEADSSGELHIHMPPRANAEEWLSAFDADLHMVGVLQGLGSSLDCFAAVTIGVLALPNNILKADLGGVRSRLRDPLVLAEAGGIRQQTAADLDRLADDPVHGWLEWALAYRNTLIHRPRPVSIHRLEAEETLAKVGGGQFIRSRDVRVLASQPGLSDMEVMAQALDPVLEEEGLITLSGAVRAAVGLLDGVSTALLDVWTTRRASPALLEQPASEWKFPLPQGGAFTGFLPGSLPYSPEEIAANPTMGRRMTAAAVLDHERPNFW